MDPDFSDQDMELWNALACCQDEEFGRLLSTGRRITSKNPQGQSLLEYACRYGHFYAIEQLLERGAHYPPPGHRRCPVQDILNFSPPLSTVRMLCAHAVQAGWSADVLIDHVMENPKRIAAMGLGHMLEVDDLTDKLRIPKEDYDQAFRKIKGTLGMFLSAPISTPSTPRPRL